MSIDDILLMLDERNSDEIQAEGIRLAETITTISIFVKPASQKIGMWTWQNCAKILYKKTDEELQPVLSRLFRWISNTTIPGAIIIAKRLHEFERNELFDRVLKYTIIEAQKLNDDEWINEIEQLVIKGDFSDVENLLQ